MIDDPLLHAQTIRLHKAIEDVSKRIDSLPQISTAEELQAIQTLLEKLETKLAFIQERGEAHEIMRLGTSAIFAESLDRIHALSMRQSNKLFDLFWVVVGLAFSNIAVILYFLSHFR